MKLNPSAKIILTFIISFALTYSLIKLITSQIEQREQNLQNEATHLLQKEIRDQFQLVLDTTLIIGKMSSFYLHNQDKGDETYGELLQRILVEKEYIIGLNQLDKNGNIFNIYPVESNQGARGKVSQNYSEILKSYERGEKFWFSPPFQLYQGSPGFVFYIPIENNNKLMGWMAPAISSPLFFKHFKTLDFFKNYELVIKDASTGNIYFETGMAHQTDELHEYKSRIFKRDIIFQTWPKTSNPRFEIPFYGRFLICLLIAFICALFMKIHLQKNKAYMRLGEISDVLKLTSNEILLNLMDIQNNFLSQADPEFKNNLEENKDLQTATNLFEQVELLRNIASSENFYEETFEILPLIKEHLSTLQEVVAKKNLKLKLESETFKDIKITGNKWLISNTVLRNALSYCALISAPNSQVEITHTVTSRECSTIFSIDKVIEEEMSKAFRIERRLLVAQNVMSLLNGEISIRYNSSGGITVKLSTEPMA